MTYLPAVGALVGVDNHQGTSRSHIVIHSFRSYLESNDYDMLRLREWMEGRDGALDIVKIAADKVRAEHHVSWLWLLLPIILTTAFIIVGAWRRAVRDAEVDAEGESE